MKRTTILAAAAGIIAVSAATIFMTAAKREAQRSGVDTARLDLLTLHNWQLVPNGQGGWAVMAYVGEKWGVYTTDTDPRRAIDAALAKRLQHG